MISDRLQAFGTTIFSEMSALALEESAVNLSQGFPDFDGPEIMLAAAEKALRSGHSQNQYARSRGDLQLTAAIADRFLRDQGLEYDAALEVCVFSGATEAIAAALIGLMNAGDEAIVFEPFYDSYPASLAMAQAKPTYVTLKFPDFALDIAALERACGPRTRVILLNSPHNPSGKVFSEQELATLAEFCCQRDLIAITDEVYERLTYDGRKHRSLASFPGMRERTLVISSAGKTFSLTGWKIGWALGASELVDAAASAHQFLTFSSASPLQPAVAAGLNQLGSEYDDQLRADYQARRDLLVAGLLECGFRVPTPEGAYFALADFSDIAPGRNDREFAQELCRRAKVAAIPPSGFYAAAPEEGAKLLRFAFCKQRETLELALDQLKAELGK